MRLLPLRDGLAFVVVHLLVHTDAIGTNDLRRDTGRAGRCSFSGSRLISSAARWLLATGLSSDGKSILRNDPVSGKVVTLGLDPDTGAAPIISIWTPDIRRIELRNSRYGSNDPVRVDQPQIEAVVCSRYVARAYGAQIYRGACFLDRSDPAGGDLSANDIARDDKATAEEVGPFGQIDLTAFFHENVWTRLDAGRPRAIEFACAGRAGANCRHDRSRKDQSRQP